MENTAPSSFIPRDAVQVGNIRRASQGGLLDLFVFISAILFVASGALGVGVFLYNQFLEASSASKVEQLERASAAFEPALIQELARLDDRMRVASEVLGRHIALSEFFRMLEQATIHSVAFDSLTFDAADPQRMTVRMNGVADSVNAIAFQADLFSKVGTVVSPIFSNINRQLDGLHFNLSAFLDSSALNYAGLVRGLRERNTLQATSTPSIVDESPVSPFDAGSTTKERASLEDEPIE